MLEFLMPEGADGTVAARSLFGFTGLESIRSRKIDNACANQADHNHKCGQDDYAILLSF